MRNNKKWHSARDEDERRLRKEAAAMGIPFPKETLCWTCERAACLHGHVAHCTWFSGDLPIDGWTVFPVAGGYRVASCPEFIGIDINPGYCEMAEKRIAAVK
jgi:hypothetical protein